MVDTDQPGRDRNSPDCAIAGPGKAGAIAAFPPDIRQCAVLEDVVGAMKRGGVQITGDDHRCALSLDEGVDRFRLMLTFTDGPCHPVARTDRRDRMDVEQRDRLARSVDLDRLRRADPVVARQLCGGAPQRKPTDHPHAGDAPLRIEEPVGVLIPQIALKCSGNIGVDFLEGDDVGARVADRSNDPIRAIIAAVDVEGHDPERRALRAETVMCAGEPKPGVDQQWCADDEQGDAEGNGEPTTGDDRRQNEQRKRHEQVRRDGVQEEQPPPAITEERPRDQPDDKKEKVDDDRSKQEIEQDVARSM